MSKKRPKTPWVRRASGSVSAPRNDAPPTPETAEKAAVVRLPVALALAFLVALPVPGLINVLEGASLALVTMLISMPIWYEAARARASPFDTLTSRAIAVVLACAGFLVFWSLLSTFGATAPARASRYIATLIAGFAIYFMVRSTVTRSRIVLYSDLLAAGLAATSALSLLGYEIGFLRDIIFKGTDRAAGFFKNPNQFGMAISTAVPAVMALILGVRERRKFRIACLLLMLLGLVASGSKTNFLLAWGTLLAMLCGHAWIFYDGLRRYLMLALSVLGSVVFAGLGFVVIRMINPRALEIMLAFFSGGGEVDSLLTRSFLWVYSIDQFLADPVLGQGAGQRIDIFYRDADVSHSHNVLLDYMRTLGAPGAIVMAVLIGTVSIICLMSIFKALRSENGAPDARLLCLGLSLSSLSYIAANMSSDSFGPSTSPFFWVFTYLSFATRSLMLSPRMDFSKVKSQVALGAKLDPFPDLLPQDLYGDAGPKAEAASKGRYGVRIALLAAGLVLTFAALILMQS